MRGGMNDTKAYVPPFHIDQSMSGTVIAKISISKSDDLKPISCQLRCLDCIEAPKSER